MLLGVILKFESHNKMAKMRVKYTHRPFDIKLDVFVVSAVCLVFPNHKDWTGISKCE